MDPIWLSSLQTPTKPVLRHGTLSVDEHDSVHFPLDPISSFSHGIFKHRPVGIFCPGHNVPPTKAPPYSRADAAAPGAHGDAADVAAASSP